ncbi:glycosyltransferase family protein [Flavivirga algicola]|uniref:Glycosyltransferase n=1 Tax=Flavivirga algicola TaxID=2729136 RepID=A0ABX1S3W5_9FLAO|nr:glycosyltransferase [Flavivirga algicola]NMH89332.1 glycosyltransferase [Flavivirga algicola]
MKKVRILYYFREESTYMHQWQRIHIFDELERHGHSIEVFNPLHYSSTEEANEKLIHYIKDNCKNFDLFLNCVGSEYIYKETIENISKIGLPTVLLCFDNLHAPFMHKKIASTFDLVWLTSKETIGMFKNWGCNKIIFQTYAANPFKFTPNWNTTIESVSFIGTPYGSRINKLNQLSQAGIRCNVYADSLINKSHERIGFKDNITSTEVERLTKNIANSLRFNVGRKVFLGALLNKYLLKKESVLNRNDNLIAHPGITFEEMRKVYSNSSLSLNITELRNTFVLKKPIHKIHLRTFEIPMCGGLEITSFTEEMASYFENEKEIVLYKTNEEFISKAKFYLDTKNESISLKMKQNARKRAELEHTWMNRFNKVFEKLY